MDVIFITGLAGSLVLIYGAAYPLEHTNNPAKSVKNWLFAIGGLIMLGYSTLNYLEGGTIFFVILQLFINSTSILMMLNTSDTFDATCIAVMGIAMIVWSLYLFEGITTVFFVIGLSGIGLGYALNMGSLKRNAALTLGSSLIAVFSFMEANMIFFWLNLFFALFSGYYAVKLLRLKSQGNS